jgi:hypothetical protein
LDFHRHVYLDEKLGKKRKNLKGAFFMSLRLGVGPSLGNSAVSGSKKDVAGQRALRAISDVLASMRPSGEAIAREIDAYITGVREGSGKSFGRPMSPENRAKIHDFLNTLLTDNLGGNKATFPKLQLFESALMSLSDSEKNMKYAAFGLNKIDELISEPDKLFLESVHILRHTKNLASTALSANQDAARVITTSRQREAQHADEWFGGVVRIATGRTAEEQLVTRWAKLNDSHQEVKTREGDNLRKTAMNINRFCLDLKQDGEEALRSKNTSRAMSAYSDYANYWEQNRDRMTAITQDPNYSRMTASQHGYLRSVNAELNQIMQQLSES